MYRCAWIDEGFGRIHRASDCGGKQVGDKIELMEHNHENRSINIKQHVSYGVSLNAIF